MIYNSQLKGIEIDKKDQENFPRFSKISQDVLFDEVTEGDWSKKSYSHEHGSFLPSKKKIDICNGFGLGWI